MDATNMYKMTTRINMLSEVDGDIFEVHVVPPVIKEPQVGVRLRRKSDLKVICMINLNLFSVSKDRVSLGLSIDESVTAYFGVGEKNLMRSISLMTYDSVKNENGVGMYLTLDYFKYFNNYFTCEQYMVFLMSRLFAIDGTLNLFEMGVFPLKADFFFNFGLLQSQIMSKETYVGIQKSVYEKLIKEPVNLSLMRVGIKREYKSVRSIVAGFGHQLYDKITNLGTKSGCMYDLCSNCETGDIPFDMLYTTSVIMVDYMGATLTCIKYEKDIYVSDDYRLAYRKLYSHNKKCQDCRKYEVNYVSIIPSEIMSEHVDVRDINSISINEEKNQVMELDALTVHEDLDYNLANQIDMLSDLDKTANDCSSGIKDVVMFEDVFDQKSLSIRSVNGLEKEFNPEIKNYLVGKDNYLSSNVYPIFSEDDRMSRYPKRHITELLLKNVNLLMGVFSTCNYILGYINSSGKAFARFRHTGCIPHYKYISDRIVFPRSLLLFCTNNIFIEKNVVKYIHLVLTWLSLGMVKMKFLGSTLLWEIDKNSVDESVLSRYIEFQCYVGGYSKTDIDPFSRDLFQKKKQVLCKITGKLTSEYYCFKYDNNIVVDAEFLDPILKDKGFFMYNYVLKLDKTNLVFDPCGSLYDIDRLHKDSYKEQVQWLDNMECGTFQEGWEAFYYGK